MWLLPRSVLTVHDSAEFMLDVVGAGATATSEIDWSDAWKQSREAMELQNELDMIYAQGRSLPPVKEAFQTEFATSWWYQLTTLFQRDARSLWRDPTYLIAKMAVNILCALIIGFTYFKSKNTVQGTQNQLFVSRVLIAASTLLCADRSPSPSTSRRSSLHRLSSNCKCPSSTCAAFMRSVNGTVVCTVGLRSSRRSYWLRFHGTSLALHCFLSVGTGRLDSLHIARDTRTCYSASSILSTTRHSARYD